MQITYDRTADRLQIYWSATADQAEWRMARADCSLLVDEANEPLALSLSRASWHVPELAGAGDVDAVFPIESLTQHAARALARPPIAPTIQPQLPWDEPMSTVRKINTRAKGVCQWCGSIAPDRRRATTRCGWPLTYLCPSCATEIYMTADTEPADQAEPAKLLYLPFVKEAVA